MPVDNDINWVEMERLSRPVTYYSNNKLYRTFLNQDKGFDTLKYVLPMIYNKFIQLLIKCNLILDKILIKFPFIVLCKHELRKNYY